MSREREDSPSVVHEAENVIARKERLDWTREQGEEVMQRLAEGVSFSLGTLFGNPIGSDDERFVVEEPLDVLIIAHHLLARSDEELKAILSFVSSNPEALEEVSPRELMSSFLHGFADAADRYGYDELLACHARELAALERPEPIAPISQERVLEVYRVIGFIVEPMEREEGQLPSLNLANFKGEPVA
ncbi:MAG: hypothetical protein HY431_00825 [Candidatus Levybacteria bacterium]|nr:hypothetical protein [Candidatus Levybacteria bacterium]